MAQQSPLHFANPTSCCSTTRSGTPHLSVGCSLMEACTPVRNCLATGCDREPVSPEPDLPSLLQRH